MNVGGDCLRGKLFNNANFDKKFKIKQMDTKVMPTQEHGRNIIGNDIDLQSFSYSYDKLASVDVYTNLRMKKDFSHSIYNGLSFVTMF